MHIRSGSRKVTALCAGILLVATAGAVGISAARASFDRTEAENFSGAFRRNLGEIAEAIQLTITPGFSNKTRVLLSHAEKRLARATIPEEIDQLSVYHLMDEYIEKIRWAQKTADEVKDTGKRDELLLETFRRLARHQPILRSIGRRSSDAPLTAVDKARYENMAIQEQLVEHVSSQNFAAATSSPTATERLLACPDCNIIIVSLTTLRKDHIGIYGYEKPTTPNIDAFFKDGLRFTNGFAPSAWTVPDAVSLFTSLFPYSHGIAVREAPSIPLLYNESIKTFAQVLSELGYRTAAFTGGGDYNARLSGLDRGFDFYLDEANYGDFNISGDNSLGGGSLLYAPLRSFVGLSAEWLAKNSDEKFFLFVQGYDTHCPYVAHEPYASRFTSGMNSALDHSICYTTHEKSSPLTKDGANYWKVHAAQRDGSSEDALISEGGLQYLTALYDARIAEADDYLQTLFRTIKALKLEENTIVILMSEHGEMLGENGWFMRGGSSRGTAYEPALNFPLLIKHPGITEPIVIDDLVQTVDIMPTLLAALQIPDPQTRIREGTSLSFSAFGDAPTNEYAYAASMFLPSKWNTSFNVPSATEAIRNTEWKLIKSSIFTEIGFRENSVSYELYNIKNDPHEENDLSATDPKRAQDLKQRLERWLGRLTY